MANETWIVVDDPKGEYWEGALVGPSLYPSLEARGVAMLPVVRDLMRRSGVGGFHKRAWGAGWSLNHTAPTLVAPLTLFCAPEFERLHWCARLVPEPGYLEKIESEEGCLFTGALRFAADPSQVNPHKLSVTARESIDARELVKGRLTRGGFDVRGTAVVRVPMEAHYGVALYGAVPGLRVAWAAASQAAE